DDRQHRALELTTLETLTESGLDAPHLVADVLAAAALARSLDVPPDAIHLAVAAFRADHHRSEVVATSGGITWIDDSKATNPHAGTPRSWHPLRHPSTSPPTTAPGAPRSPGPSTTTWEVTPMADTPSSLPRRLVPEGSTARGRDAQHGAALVAVKKLFAAEST